MEDLQRLLALMKYCSDQVDREGLNTLYDVIVNKVPFDTLEHDIENAVQVALTAMHTFFDVEQEDDKVLGKAKLSMAGLFGGLALSLERMENFREGQADEWRNL